MTAATRDLNTSMRGAEENFIGFPVADNVHIYKGTLVALNVAGLAIPAADAANAKVMGVAQEGVDNTLAGHIGGGKTIKVRSGCEVRLPATSITQAMVGTTMYVVDDNTFDDAVGTNSIKAGVLTEYVSATEGYIFIPTTGAARLA